MDKLNNVNNPSSIHTYDFSTLYTNLPLDLVRNELFEMIDKYFDINERKSNRYIVLNHFRKTAQFASVNPLTPNRSTVHRYKKSVGCRTDLP